MVKKALTFHYVDNKTDISIPFVGGIKAGFPNPVQDYIESSIGLSKGLINHP